MSSSIKCLRVCALFVVALAGLLMASSAAQADIITPVAATESSQAMGNVGCGNLIDGSGLSFVPTTTTPITAMPTCTNVYTNCWAGEFDGVASGQWVAFDLGASYDLTGVYTWNGFANHMSKDVDVFVLSSLPASTTTMGTLPSGTLIGSYTLASVASSGSDIAGELDAVSGTGQYVMLHIKTNYGTNTIGFNEVRFVGTATVVPEPGTLALLAGGLLGLIAYAWRKRK
jgi:hypothetical protein